MQKLIIKSSFMLLLMLFSIISFLFAKELNIDIVGDENRITVTENTYEKLSLFYSFSNIKSFEVQTDKGVFNEIIIQNTYYIGDIGTPKLPAAKKLVEIPFGAEVSINVKNYTITEYKLSDYGITNPLIPVQPSLPKNIDPTTVEFEYNIESYIVDSYSDHELATIEILGVLRGVRLARIDVSLVRYNPVKGMIQVYNNIEVSVDFINSDIELTEYTKASTYSPYFESVYERIINYRQHGYPAHPDLTTYPVKYLIVSHRMFETQLAPFIEWKTQKGFTVLVGYTDEIGYSYYEIQTWIHDIYNAGTPTDPAPSFVLFVGDTGQVPSTTGSTTNKVTDLYYCSVDGDYFPEMYYGRFSAINTTQAQTQVERTLYYEKYEFDDPSFLDDVTLIAGADSYWNPHVGQPTVLYGTENYFNAAYGFDEVHAYLTTYAGCYATIDDGICMINYTAHGGQTSWSNPNMTQTMVNNLINVGQYPLAIGNCCLACDFGYSECFGETWARATHNTTGEPTGSIGYIGSAPSSYWWEDFYWAVGAFPTPGGYVPSYDETTWGMYDAPFVTDYVTQDALIFIGNLAVTEAHTQGWPTHVSAGPIYYWQAYNLLGDPSVVVYMTQGEVNDVSFAGLLPIGSTSFTVDAEPGSYVGISMNGVLHGAALVDESGSVNVPIIPFTTAGTADIVVTKPQYQPVIETVVVATPAVIVIDPTSILINTLTDVTISVYEEDGTTPIPDVNIEISGLGAFGTLQGITDTSGTCALNFGGYYGGSEILNMRGWRAGDEYDLFNEYMEVTGGLDLTDPDIWITTTFGLSDTFGLNMPATVHFTQVETDCDYAIYIADLDTFIIESLNDSINYTPSTLTDIYAFIIKTDYNVYTEYFTTIEVYGTVSGIVINSETGNPVSDIEVKFYEQGADPTTDDPIFTDITDVNGLYEVTDEQPVDYYDIYINEWGFDPYEELNYFLGYGSNTHDIVIDPVESGVIHGQIYDDDKGGVGNATLIYYRSDNGEEFEVVQANAAGRYSVTLPFFTYDIYVSAPEHVPYRGTITVLGDAIKDYHLGIAALFSNFEDDDGGFSPTPTTNAWEWGEPTAGGISAYSGINVWATKLDGYYVNNANWYLHSPEFTVTSDTFTFYHYYDFENPSTFYDGGNVKISTNGGTSFTLITPVGGYDGTIDALDQPGFGGTIDDWELVEFDLSNYENDDVILRWHFASDGGVYNYYGWYIDDVLVGDPNSSWEDPIFAVGNNQFAYELSLNQNYPNPVRGSTTISFSLPRNIATDLHRLARIKIYNIKGQLVKELEIRNYELGIGEVVWDTKDDSGKPVANGIYFYCLKVGDKVVDTKKCLLIR
ncbi:MAG: choice-of-anchor J domain-containing protein [Candidatus Cloacimonetes bacterium]|nr:choice-of-anchor J domain-containing protein [Candidatus Cloacimonadota bacterium]